MVVGYAVFVCVASPFLYWNFGLDKHCKHKPNLKGHPRVTQ